MQTAQLGDLVRIHYIRRFEDGSVTSSRERAPLELTVGIDHPRLPGLGTSLVGLAPGARTAVHVPAERAYGAADPSRVQRWSRSRFPDDQAVQTGRWVRIQTGGGRNHLVRIVEVRGDLVIVDANHRWAGQAMELEVELISIRTLEADPAVRMTES